MEPFFFLSFFLCLVMCDDVQLTGSTFDGGTVFLDAPGRQNPIAPGHPGSELPAGVAPRPWPGPSWAHWPRAALPPSCTWEANCSGNEKKTKLGPGEALNPALSSAYYKNPRNKGKRWGWGAGSERGKLVMKDTRIIKCKLCVINDLH